MYFVTSEVNMFGAYLELLKAQESLHNLLQDANHSGLGFEIQYFKSMIIFLYQTALFSETQY